MPYLSWKKRAKGGRNDPKDPKYNNKLVFKGHIINLIC